MTTQTDPSGTDRAPNTQKVEKSLGKVCNGFELAVQNI